MALSQFNQTLTCRRLAAGSYTMGRYTAGAETGFFIEASVQPLRGKEIEQLPEGRREQESYRLYTHTEMFADNPDTEQTADEVDLFGKTFEVIKVEIWQNRIISHYKVIVSLKKR